MNEHFDGSMRNELENMMTTIYSSVLAASILKNSSEKVAGPVNLEM